MFGRCPCGSSRPLSVCCGPFHGGAEPPDAPSLMRSRWSAYAVRDFAYLWRTLHPDHPDRADTFESFRARAEADALGLRYRKLLPDRDLPRPIEALTFDAFHLAARR